VESYLNVNSLTDRDIPTRDIIVIGGSAGAIQPLKTILRTLPADLPVAVFVVIHMAPSTPSELATSMANVGPLRARVAADGESIEYGRVYVAPPDHHVLIRQDSLSVVRGPYENRSRPAIDPTFRTAANVFASRVLAVLLSGALNDGTHGAMVVKAHGGLVICAGSI
jgi:two-component system chemotaxis response regulator CheB